jgi:cytochrome c-type protein NapC
MQWVTAEYKESIHHNNASGVRAGCADCHVPKALGPKLYAKVMAAKDVYHEILGTINTEEKFEALRWDMASRVWARMRANDSVGCRSCHSLTAMNAEAQSAQARKKHEKAAKEGETCIECHRGVAHEEPMEPDEPEQAAEGAPASG